jgi:hypothetical protein
MLYICSTVLGPILSRSVFGPFTIWYIKYPHLVWVLLVHLIFNNLLQTGYKYGDIHFLLDAVYVYLLTSPGNFPMLRVEAARTQHPVSGSRHFVRTTALRSSDIELDIARSKRCHFFPLRSRAATFGNGMLRVRVLVASPLYIILAFDWLSDHLAAIFFEQ